MSVYELNYVTLYLPFGSQQAESDSNCSRGASGAITTLVGSLLSVLNNQKKMGVCLMQTDPDRTFRQRIQATQIHRIWRLLEDAHS